MSQDCCVDNSGLFGTNSFQEQVNHGVTKFRLGSPLKSPSGSVRVLIYYIGNNVRIAQKRYPGLYFIVEVERAWFEQYIISSTELFTIKDKVDFLFDRAKYYSLLRHTVMAQNLKKALGWNGMCEEQN